MGTVTTYTDISVEATKKKTQHRIDLTSNFASHGAAASSPAQWRALAPRASAYSSCTPHAIKCWEGPQFQTAAALEPRTQALINFIRAKLLPWRKNRETPCF